MSYGEGTWYIFQALTKQNLENGSMIERISEEDFFRDLQKYNRIVSNLLDTALLPHEKKKELANRLQIDKSLLSNAIREKNPRPLKRDHLLSVMFLIDPIPTVDQVNHKLMELKQPGLFTETAFRTENRRNWVMYRVLEYAHTHPCPMENWLVYVSAVMERFGLMPLLELPQMQTFSEEDEAMLVQWQTTFATIGYTDFSVRRNEMLARYRVREHLTKQGGRRKAIEKLSKEAKVSTAQVESMFGTLTNRNSNVSADILIPVFAVMGCTLYEANEMLLQANRPLVYHTVAPAAGGDAYEFLQWIGKLMQNTKEPPKS